MDNRCKLRHAIYLLRQVQAKVREHGLSPRIAMDAPRWYVRQCVRELRNG